AVRRRGGLLEERGDRFQFMHLTFQEYLAAQFLARQWTELPDDFLFRIVVDGWGGGVLLLTVGRLGAAGPYKGRAAFVEALCNRSGPMAVRLAAAELAATGLGDLTEPEPTLVGAVRQRLLDLWRDPTWREAKPATRALAGQALAVLGDDRDFE